MTPPKKIYLGQNPTTGEPCDDWQKTQCESSDVPYFSEDAIREAEFAILDQVRESLGSTFGIILNSAKITEDIIKLLKGASDD